MRPDMQPDEEGEVLWCGRWGLRTAHEDEEDRQEEIDPEEGSLGAERALRLDGGVSRHTQYTASTRRTSLKDLPSHTTLAVG